MDSQIPGPSHISTTNTNNTSESDSEEENQISDDESPCLIFTKWVQCDECRDWVHLIYCTEKRVIRKGTGFVCPHCKSD